MENNQKEFQRKRIQEELNDLFNAGDIKADLVIEENQDYVIYFDLETSGGTKNLPAKTNVIVPVPNGYPSAPIDMPALPVNSPLIKLVVGSSNPQGIITVMGIQWQLLSFHPYNGQFGPQWNPNKHGFHDYYQHLYTWLHKI